MSSPQEFRWLSEPGRGAVGVRGLFGVLGGPAAWYLQLCVGDWLASGPCFPGQQRYLAPPLQLSWTWPALIILLIVCALIAFAAFAVSWRIFRETQRAGGVSPPEPMVPPIARVRFMALWGMVFGAGFCAATLVTVIAFATLPRCAG